jgi:hypothetical protein
MECDAPALWLNMIDFIIVALGVYVPGVTLENIIPLEKSFPIGPQFAPALGPSNLQSAEL